MTTITNPTRPLPVLFTHYGEDWIRGSEVVLLELLSTLDKDKVRPVVWCNSPAMSKASRDAGYTTYQDEFRYMFDYGSPKPSMAHFSTLVKKCRVLCREHGIRVLHSNSLAPVQWLAIAGMTERIPVLAHLHIDYLRRSRYALLMHAATLIVGVSRQVIDGPIKDGIEPERTRVIYNGIDFSRLDNSNIDLRGVLGIGKDAFVIATAGSLITRKGHDVLIRAFHQLPSKSTPQHLLIAGSGPESNALRDLTRELEISDRVHFLGYIDVRPLLAAADVFALASRRDSFGLALAEAGYCGLPAVSTRVGGIPEVIVHGETGLLTAPDDVSGFSRALATLMNDNVLRQRLGMAAKQRVEANFTALQMARQFEDTYLELASLPKENLGFLQSARRVIRPYSRLLRYRWLPPEPRYTA